MECILMIKLVIQYEGMQCTLDNTLCIIEHVYFVLILCIDVVHLPGYKRWKYFAKDSNGLVNPSTTDIPSVAQESRCVSHAPSATQESTRVSISSSISSTSAHIKPCQSRRVSISKSARVASSSVPIVRRETLGWTRMVSTKLHPKD